MRGRPPDANERVCQKRREAAPKGAELHKPEQGDGAEASGFDGPARVRQNTPD